MNEEQFLKKVNIISKILDNMGLHLIDDDVRQTMMDYFRNILPK